MQLSDLLVPVGNTTVEFNRLVERSVAHAPLQVAALAERFKLKIVAAPTVIDFDPRYRGVTPRGWQAGTTWAHADGFYQHASRTVLVTEGRIDQKTGKLVQTERVRGVLYHEFGHGLDAALGFFSKSIEFVTAYLADVAVLLRHPQSAKLEAELAYFLQGFELQKGKLTCAGLSETMAEVFAVISGETPNKKNRRLMLRAFPRTIACVRRHLQCL